jgi:pyruvate,water dikinase
MRDRRTIKAVFQEEHMDIQDPQAQPILATLPIPPDFPVTWEHPGDATLFWTFDPTHPDAMPRLAYDFLRDCLRGFNDAAEVYALPIRVHTRHLNTYLYQAITPIAATPDELAALGKRSEERLGDAMARLGELWSGEWLPTVQTHLLHWRSVDLGTLAPPALLAHLDETLARSQQVWAIHFRLVFPVFLAISLFEEFYHDLFPDSDPFGAFQLLQGFDQKTLEADRALWQLSRRAVARAEVREALATNAAVDIPRVLQRSAAGRAFLDELHTYLDRYGRRASQCLVSAPNWIEDPTPVITNLQHYIDQPERDPQAELAALAAKRNRLVAAARERLDGYPGPVREQFEALLTAAQTATVLSEEHAFWIDYASMYEVRRVFLEYGRRLAQDSRIDQPEDVFYLALEEVREHATAPPGPDRRALVTRRKAALEHFRTITPPGALGTLPADAPADDPLGRALGKVFGTPPQLSADPHVLPGHAGAPGVASGPARVIHTLAEADRVQPGDVLVAPATLPPWTPLFATAAAVVTDAGGILSHCAIVAREYGIPAVVGSGTATSLIKDGQLLEVDGSAGIVRIIS